MATEQSGRLHSTESRVGSTRYTSPSAQITISSTAAALAGVLAVGIALRTAVYLRSYNFYIDEASLASSILSRDWRGLLEPPLDYGQLAPAGFLLLEEAMSTWLGSSEHALRALPFAACLLTLPLLVALGRRVLDRHAVLLVAAMAAFSYGLIFYGTQVKQYATDTLISTALLLGGLSLERRDWPLGRSAAYGILGAVLVWISQSAILVLAGVTLAAMWLRRKPPAWPGLGRVLLMSGIWGVSAVAAARFGIQYVQQPAYTNEFWRSGYLPWPPSGLFDLTWPLRALLRPLLAIGLLPGFYPATKPLAVFTVELTFLAGPPLILALAAGVSRAWRSGDRAWLYLAGPVLTTFLAAVLHAYPYGSDFFSGGRTLLFLAPTYLMLIAYGAQPLWHRFPQWRRPAAMAIGLAPLVLVTTWLPNRQREELEPLLRSVAARLHPGDKLYLYYGALPAFRYYAPRTGIDTLGRVEGVCSILDPQAYAQDFERLRPSSGLWVVFSHVNRIHGWGEDRLILAQLDRFGSRTDSLREKGASAHRYVLTPPDIPARAGPVPYVLPDPLPHGVHRYDCAAGFGPQRLPVRAF